MRALTRVHKVKRFDERTPHRRNEDRKTTHITQ
jgi:hypothetical protein